jgi:hypothetical protein
MLDDAGYKDAEIQDTKIQGCRIQRCRDTGIEAWKVFKVV